MNPQSVQVCFVLDCTASMQPWIDAAKNKMVDTLERIREQYPEYSISAAFVGYRDFEDPEPFVRVHFTSDLQKVEESIMNVVADGGDDVCEDVAGAYRFVNGLDWTSTVRCVFHITDAPNHGLEYHEEYIEDEHPLGHPYIDLKDETQDLAHKNIDLTVFSVNRSTDMMYKIMRNIYQDIRPDRFNVVNLKNRRYVVEDVFETEVSQRILSSISMSTSDPRSP